MASDLPFLHPPAMIAALLAMASPAASQDLGGALLFGMGQRAFAEGQSLLEETPRIINDMLGKAEKGETYGSPEECLGVLQLSVSVGTVAANLLPFSSVTTLEDRRGPVGRFRIMMNGKKVHMEVFCREETLSAELLSWGRGNPDSVTVTKGTFDAAAGVMLLLQAQGAFGTTHTETTSAAEPKPKAEAPAAREDLAPGEIAARIEERRLARDELARQPMTSEEWGIFKDSIRECWDIDTLSVDAALAKVTVSFTLTREGWPVNDTIRLVGSSSEYEHAARESFDAVRQAIVRCGVSGLAVPKDKYKQWKELELVFDPTYKHIY